MAEGTGEAGATRRLIGGMRWASAPAWLLAGSIAALVVFVGIIAPVALSRGAIGQDANARELLLDAVPRMRSCASLEGNGSFAACDAAEMAQMEPSVRWRDGLAPVGWGRGGVGEVFVSDLDETGYRLETTSASGRVFKYEYEGGVVKRETVGGGPGGGW